MPPAWGAGIPSFMGIRITEHIFSHLELCAVFQSNFHHCATAALPVPRPGPSSSPHPCRVTGRLGGSLPGGDAVSGFPGSRRDPSGSVGGRGSSTARPLSSSAAVRPPRQEGGRCPPLRLPCVPPPSPGGARRGSGSPRRAARGSAAALRPAPGVGGG